MTASGVITETALAKINLALHVTERRLDGYHELDSVVAFASFGDTLSFEAADADRFVVEGPFASRLGTSADNIVIKARDLIRTRTDLQPVSIKLDKNLPVASGIGGGSADAAATLRGLNRMASQPLPHDVLSKLALQLGADVPVCFRGVASRMRGIGEIVEAFGERLPAAIVLVNPLIALATKDVFGALGLARGQRFSSALDAGHQASWRNDLTEPAIRLLPRIGDVLKAMQAFPDLSAVRMSGSGATCFGLTNNITDAEACSAKLKKLHPDWWCVAGKLG
jgi:4-diphosphocytidyl-2-C-methyl-D-erythritol kinase